MKRESKFKLITEPEYGPLDPKVNLKPDFFSGFIPDKRKEIVTAEAAFYKELTTPYSVDDRIDTWYDGFQAKDKAEIPVKIYKPKNAAEELPVHMFFHGGGFITCSIETHNYVPSYIAANANCMVISVEYRLAPEYKFPIGLEDCYQSIQWVNDQAQNLNVDVTRLSVGGDSAGGNISAVLCLMAKERKEFQISSQVLIYPGTGAYNKFKLRSAEVYPPIGSGDMDVMKMYLNETDDPSNLHLSPFLADDVTGFPPALFIEAECDPLLDDGLMYAKKLQDAGVPVQYMIYKGMPHAFILRIYEETFAALNEICTFLKDQ